MSVTANMPQPLLLLCIILYYYYCFSRPIRIRIAWSCERVVFNFVELQWWVCVCIKIVWIQCCNWCFLVSKSQHIQCEPHQSNEVHVKFKTTAWTYTLETPKISNIPAACIPWTFYAFKFCKRRQPKCDIFLSSLLKLTSIKVSTAWALSKEHVQRAFELNGSLIRIYAII